MKVIITAEAKSDLRAIVRWIGTDNPGRSNSFSAELRDACAKLGRHPLRFPVVRDASGIAVRKRVHGRYLILYRVLETEVEILRIVHGSRNWVALVGETDQATGGSGVSIE